MEEHVQEGLTQDELTELDERRASNMADDGINEQDILGVIDK